MLLYRWYNSRVTDYLFPLVFFILGIGIGYKIRAKIFCLMVDQGQLVFKADGRWVGEAEAFVDIAKRVIRE